MNGIKKWRAKALRIIKTLDKTVKICYNQINKKKRGI